MLVMTTNMTNRWKKDIVTKELICVFLIIIVPKLGYVMVYTVAISSEVCFY